MNEVISLTCDQAQERMDLYISQSIAHLSRTYIQKLIERGCVRKNGVVVRSKKEGLKLGDEIEINLPEPETLAAVPEDIPLDIVYEDDDVIIVNKPQGWWYIQRRETQMAHWSMR